MTNKQQMTPLEQALVTLLFLTAYIMLLPLMAIVALYRAIPDKQITIILKRI